jgi:hypothetical protein
MTREEYIQKVEAVLNQYSHQAASRLAATFADLPPKTRKVNIEIFIDEDGEGFLTVRVVLDGPDLYVLNKAIAPHAELFGTCMTREGFDPPLPLMEPGEETFSVHDTLSDCAAAWITSIWKQTKREPLSLPVAIVTHDGYGTTTPLQLNP